jgi:hypothetical protein
MMTAVSTDELLNRSRQRQSFAKRCTLSHLHNQARDATRCRLLSQLAKQPRQLFLAVLVYDRSGSQLRAGIHAHVEGTIAHEAEPALRIFELPGRDTNIEKRAADRANSKLIENADCAAEIRLSHRKPFAEARQLFTDVLDRVRITVQRQNIGPTLQNRFSVATTTTCSIYNQRTRLRFE